MSASRVDTEAGGAKPPATDAAPGAGSVRVWDPLVRLFHWSLVVTFTAAWATGDEFERLHEWTGYAIVGLLAVRIAWGFVGSQHARFSDFVYRPSAVTAYLFSAVRLRAKRYMGHNPAGGAMVIALLLVIAAACATGIMLTTQAYWGVEWVTEAHELLANLAVVLVGLHLVGVFAASVEHRENLVRSMITGRKRSE